MKKVLTLIFVIAILVVGMAPAMANPSIGTPTMTGEAEVIRDEEHPVSAEVAERLDNGWSFGATEVQPEMITNTDVAEAVKAVNSSETNATPEDTLSSLQALQPEDGLTAADLAGYDYVTQFTALVLTDGTEYYFTGEDDKMVIRVKLKIDALVGENPENLGNYLVMVIDPNTGVVTTSPLLADTFDSAEGTVDVEFSSTGMFALIQK